MLISSQATCTNHRIIFLFSPTLTNKAVAISTQNSLHSDADPLGMVAAAPHPSLFFCLVYS